MPDRPTLTPARRRALAVLLHAERTSSDVRYSNHTTPVREFRQRRRRMTVNWPAADWLEAEGLIHPRGAGVLLQLTEAGRDLAVEQEAQADG